MILSCLAAAMPSAEPVRSRANVLFKRLRTLKERGPQGGLCLLEGPKLVLEALNAGLEIVEAAFAPRAETTPAGAAALAALRAHGVRTRALSAELLASLSDAETPQGLLALARRPLFAEEQLFRGMPLVLVADGVQNPGNLGGLLRTAEAAGATGAFVTAGSADPLSWKALRGSMGSAFRLPQLHGLAIDVVLDRLQARGLAVVATAADGDRGYDEADLRGPTAIVVGAEGSGLAPSVKRRATARLRIPLAAPVESLNVTVAGALVLYEAARQRGFPPRGSES
jgi:TrmH family RNA methyltransferase